MSRRTSERLLDIMDAIQQIELLTVRFAKTELAKDRVALAAFERFIEILSETSRHIPQTDKEIEDQIPWQDIANIGNYLRHAYQTVDFELLWDIYDAGQLAQLREAVQRISMRTQNRP
jgi:uncharacterized protein with HEPN domain